MLGVIIGVTLILSCAPIHYGRSRGLRIRQKKHADITFAILAKSDYPASIGSVDSLATCGTL